MADQITNDEAADKVRAYRMFTSLASAALGVEPDQNYAGEDAYIGAPAGVHQVSDPYRGSVVQGTSNRVTTSTGTVSGGLLDGVPVLLLLAGAWLLWANHKKG